MCIERALADDEVLLNRWDQGMFFVFVTKLRAGCLLAKVTGIDFMFFVWSQAVLDYV